MACDLGDFFLKCTGIIKSLFARIIILLSHFAIYVEEKKKKRSVLIFRTNEQKYPILFRCRFIYIFAPQINKQKKDS